MVWRVGVERLKGREREREGAGGCVVATAAAERWTTMMAAPTTRQRSNCDARSIDGTAVLLPPRRRCIYLLISIDISSLAASSIS